MEIHANFPDCFIKFNEILKAEVMNHMQSRRFIMNGLAEVEYHFIIVPVKCLLDLSICNP